MQVSRIRPDGAFIYAGPFKSRTTAVLELEDMFAAGDVCASEAPRIDTIRDHHNRVRGYAVVLPPAR